MSDRRAFLETLALGGVALAVGARATAPTAAQTPAPAIPPAAKEGPWDSSWLDQLTAKHKQIFDISAYADGGGLFYAKNYFNAHRDAAPRTRTSRRSWEFTAMRTRSCSPTASGPNTASGTA